MEKNSYNGLEKATSEREAQEKSSTDNEKKLPEVKPAIIIEIEADGSILLKSNIRNKMMIKHSLEMALEVTVEDLKKNSNMVWVPGQRMN